MQQKVKVQCYYLKKTFHGKVSLLFISTELREELLQESDETAQAGHFGVQKVTQAEPDPVRHDVTVDLTVPVGGCTALQDKQDPEQILAGAAGQYRDVRFGGHLQRPAELANAAAFEIGGGSP